MADNFYVPYLLVLLLLPLLALRRWGLAASVGVTVVELALVAIVFYLMDIFHLFPDPLAGGSPPKHPFEKMRQRQAAGIVLLSVWVIGPALAALAGGGLAVVWSAAQAVRRFVPNRRMRPQP